MGSGIRWFEKIRKNWQGEKSMELDDDGDALKALERMEEVVNFLLGSDTLDGWGFGEQPGKRPAYWWRTELRKAWEEHQSRLTSAPVQSVTVEEFNLKYGMFVMSTKKSSYADFVATFPSGLRILPQPPKEGDE